VGCGRTIDEIAETGRRAARAAQHRTQAIAQAGVSSIVPREGGDAGQSALDRNRVSPDREPGSAT